MYNHILHIYINIDMDIFYIYYPSPNRGAQRLGLHRGPRHRQVPAQGALNNNHLDHRQCLLGSSIGKIGLS